MLHDTVILARYHYLGHSYALVISIFISINNNDHHQSSCLIWMCMTNALTTSVLTTFSGRTTNMLNLTAKKRMMFFPNLVKPSLFFKAQLSITKHTIIKPISPPKLPLELSELAWQFFYHLKSVLMSICPNPVKLSRLFFGMIVTINSLISVTLAHANTEFFFIAPANPTSAKTAQSHHMPIGLHQISQTVSYRIHMLPNIQKQRNPMMVVSHDKENDALPSANEILEMDKVELTSLQVMHVLSEICPSVLSASQQKSFQRAFNTRLQDLLPNVDDPQAIMHSLSTQRNYRRELNSLKSWLNGVAKSEKSSLGQEIGTAPL